MATEMTNRFAVGDQITVAAADERHSQPLLPPHSPLHRLTTSILKQLDNATKRTQRQRERPTPSSMSSSSTYTDRSTPRIPSATVVIPSVPTASVPLDYRRCDPDHQAIKVGRHDIDVIATWAPPSTRKRRARRHAADGAGGIVKLFENTCGSVDVSGLCGGT